MKRENANSSGKPDPHALGIATAAQKAVAPDVVILFGSRAAGDYREDSDVDIMVVAESEHHVSAGAVTEHAAQSYMMDNPPELELGVISMNRQTFDRCRRATQHIAGQAARHGIPMLGPLPGPGDESDRGADDHWPATLQWLDFARENREFLDRLVKAGYHSKSMVGSAAQRAASGILRVWLSTHNPPWRYRHGLELVWEQIRQLEDPEAPKSRRAVEAARELVEYTRVEGEGGNSSWLDPYRDTSGDGPRPRSINNEEQKDSLSGWAGWWTR